MVCHPAVGHGKGHGKHQGRGGAQHHRPAPQKVLRPLLPPGGQPGEHRRRRRQHRQQQPLPLGGSVLHNRPGIKAGPAAHAPGNALGGAVHHPGRLSHGGDAERLRHTPVPSRKAPQGPHAQRSGYAAQGGRVGPLGQHQHGHFVQQRHQRSHQGGGVDRPRPLRQEFGGSPVHRPAEDGENRLGNQDAQGSIVGALAEKGDGHVHLLQYPGRP